MKRDFIAFVLLGLLAVFWICVGAIANPATPQMVTLAWDPPADALPGTIYRIHYGTKSRGTNAGFSYSTNIVVGGATSYTISGLNKSTTYFFTVTAAYAAGGLESPFSNEIAWQSPPIPSAPASLRVPIP